LNFLTGEFFVLEWRNSSGARKKTVEGGANKRRPEIPTPNDRIGTISKNQGRDIEKQLKWVLNLVHH